MLYHDQYLVGSGDTVFHDDQHGTAIISAAGLLNALELTGKKIDEIRVVVNGAGASAISCTKLYISLGVKPKNVLMVDSKGVISTERNDLNKYKQQFAQKTKCKTLADAVKNADVFLGLSIADALKKEMLKSMAPDPIVFAMANPNSEIAYEDAMATRKDIIFATGRSDYPNQINNVLGFPFIFRGALDVKAKGINEEMKLAAVYALADLTKKEVPEAMNTAYKAKNLVFSREYIIPKPLDPQLITTVAPAVAKAAIDSGIARKPITNWENYKVELLKRMGIYNPLINDVRSKARSVQKRIVFASADNYNILKAVQMVMSEGIAQPILLGDKDEIKNIAEENKFSLEGLEIIDPKASSEKVHREEFAQILFGKRKRKGLTWRESQELMMNPTYYGIMLVEIGKADLIVDGEMQTDFALNKELLKKHYPFSKLVDQDVNTIIFPNLSSGNIAYKMMCELGEAELIGPLMLGLKKPIHILQMNATVRDIVNMTAIAAVDAQSAKEDIIQL